MAFNTIQKQRNLHLPKPFFFLLNNVSVNKRNQVCFFFSWRLWPSKVSSPACFWTSQYFFFVLLSTSTSTRLHVVTNFSLQSGNTRLQRQRGRFLRVSWRVHKKPKGWEKLSEVFFFLYPGEMTQLQRWRKICIFTRSCFSVEHKTFPEVTDVLVEPVSLCLSLSVSVWKLLEIHPLFSECVC